MSFTLADLLLVIIAAVAIGMLAVLVRLSTRVTRAAEEVEVSFHYLNSIRPTVDRLLREAEDEVSEMREMTQRANRIAADVQDISGSARRLTLPLLTQFTAVLAGAKVGLEAFHRLSRGSVQARDKDGRC